jgi:hypothetical protein
MENFHPRVEKNMSVGAKMFKYRTRKNFEPDVECDPVPQENPHQVGKNVDDIIDAAMIETVPYQVGRALVLVEHPCVEWTVTTVPMLEVTDRYPSVRSDASYEMDIIETRSVSDLHGNQPVRSLKYQLWRHRAWKYIYHVRAVPGRRAQLEKQYEYEKKEIVYPRYDEETWGPK